MLELCTWPSYVHIYKSKYFTSPELAYHLVYLRIKLYEVIVTNMSQSFCVLGYSYIEQMVHFGIHLEMEARGIHKGSTDLFDKQNQDEEPKMLFFPV